MPNDAIHEMRNTRIERQFRNNYSKENIYKRILETQPEHPYYPDLYLLIHRAYKKYDEIKERYYQNKGAISWLIFHYEKLFGINTENASKLNITKMTPELISAIKKMDEFSKQFRFVCKNSINTEQKLLDYQKSTYEKINPLKSKMENLLKSIKEIKQMKKKQILKIKL